MKKQVVGKRLILKGLTEKQMRGLKQSIREDIKIFEITKVEIDDANKIINLEFSEHESVNDYLEMLD